MLNVGVYFFAVFFISDYLLVVHNDILMVKSSLPMNLKILRNKYHLAEGALLVWAKYKCEFIGYVHLVFHNLITMKTSPCSVE